MPLGDGTGPTGMGSMTGRAAGYCAGFGVPGFMNNQARGFGFARGGFGMGRGRGFGRRNQFYATGLTGWQRAAGAAYAEPVQPAPTQQRNIELETLKAQASYAEETLKDIRSRIEELEADNK